MAVRRRSWATRTATAPSKETDEGVGDWTKPPFLRRVRIRGYKSIAFCDVQLQPLTILVGRNAAGKSNFLDAVAFLRDVVSKGVNEAVKLHGGAKSIVCQTASQPVVSIEIDGQYVAEHPLTTRWIARFALEIDFPRRGRPHIDREEARFESPNGHHWTEYVVEGRRVDWGGDSLAHGVSEWRNTDRPLLGAYGEVTPFLELLDHLRLVNTYNFNPESIRQLHRPMDGVVLENDGGNLANVIEQLKENSSASSRRVRDYLALVTEEIENFSAIRYGEFETIRFKLRGGSKDRPLEFDAASMSDGTLRALAALVAAFQSHLPDGPSVIGIEEPETSLHPAATQALVDALDEATQHTQIILTTHSADLLSGRDITPGQVLVVRNRGGETQITPVDPASREIVEKELYSLADLQRMDQLNLDEADLKRQEQLRAAAEGD